MRAVKLETIISKDRKLSLTVPEEIPSGPVEVVILSKALDVDRETSLMEFLNYLDTLPMSKRSLEEFELDIEAERQAWEK